MEIKNNTSCVGCGDCSKCRKCLKSIYPGIHTKTNRKKDFTNFPSDFHPEKKMDYGVAFDIGTTTVVGILWNLCSAELIDTEAASNYQYIFGSDVISRIRFCNSSPENLSHMQGKIISCMNDILDKLYTRNTLSPDNISNITIVGNTTMSHLVLGINPEPLSRAPFTPVFCELQKLKAKELPLNVYPDANIYILPNISGHVGSDTVGMILASNFYKNKGCHIAIDIGTNGEIVIIRNGQMLTCSTAAGPAFEGASIAQGMRASSGAIEHVVITPDNVILHTVDNQPAVGICGSGLIDIASELLKCKILDKTGRMLTCEEALAAGISPSLASRISGSGRNKSFRLTSDNEKYDVSITQQDIRELQLAKGAILAGIQTLMKISDIQKEQVDSIIIAGAFGNYIHIENAMRIGLFPDIPEGKIFSIGNAAGTGASMVLLSDSMKELASSIASNIQHVELSMNTDFYELYINAMNFK